MSGEVDKGIGEAKKSVGEMTGDEDLEAEGTAQKDSGKLQEVGDKIKDAADNVADKFKKN